MVAAAALALLVGACAPTREPAPQPAAVAGAATGAAGNVVVSERALRGTQRDELVATPGPGSSAGSSAGADVSIAPGGVPTQDPGTLGLRSAGARAFLPFVRVDREAGRVEVDATVAIDVNDRETPKVWLELMACTTDTREYESLVVTRARASHVHAALLALGLEPGAPGQVRAQGAAEEPTGAAVDVRFRYLAESVGTPGAGGLGKPTIREESPTSWVVSDRTGETFPGGATAPAGEGRLASGFVFAGSAIRPVEGWDGRVRRMYAAEASGALVGLATFGSETIAWRGVMSPDSRERAEEWIADVRRVPRAGTKVVIVIGKAEK